MLKRGVCISRTLGAGGEEIGREVAERLGFKFVDDEIILRAARKVNVDPGLVEQAEHRQPLIDRVLEWMGRAAEVPTPGAAPVAQQAAAFVPEDFRALIRAVIFETARKGDVVLMAHAASMALGFMEGVLRVLVTASFETRVKRFSVAERKDEKEAAKALRDSDRERQEYFKRFYQLDEELPTHYDLIINTDVLTPAHATKIIVAGAGR